MVNMGITGPDQHCGFIGERTAPRFDVGIRRTDRKSEFVREMEYPLCGMFSDYLGMKN